MTCETCRWWEGRDGSVDYEGRAMCQLTLTRDGSPDHPASLALAQDYESYRAYLLTAPEFGCVQWEQTSVALTKQPTSE